jgi:hypothetical protein
MYPSISPPCSFDLSATSQQYFSLRTNQPISNQPAVFFFENKSASAASQTNNLQHAPKSGTVDRDEDCTNLAGRSSTWIPSTAHSWGALKIWDQAWPSPQWFTNQERKHAHLIQKAEASYRDWIEEWTVNIRSSTIPPLGTWRKVERKEWRKMSDQDQGCSPCLLGVMSETQVEDKITRPTFHGAPSSFN